MLVIGTGDSLFGVAGTGTAVTVTATGVDVTNASGAESLGKLYQGQLPTSAASLFMVASGHSFVIKTLSITNATGSSVSGIQLFLSGSAGSNSLIGPMTLGAHFTATFSDNGWSVTDASGNIQTVLGGSTGITQLTGDVAAGPGSGSQVATIQPAVVTLAKIANAVANSKLLGSGASGAGSSYVELTLGTNLSITGTTLNAAGSSLNFADGEVPSGSGTAFTLAHSPSPALSLQLFVAGIIMKQGVGNDYTLSGNAITMATSVPGGASIQAWYRY